MKLTAQQLRSLVESVVLNEVANAKITSFVQQADDAIKSLVSEELDGVRATARDPDLRAALVTYEVEVLDAAFGRASAFIEGVLGNSGLLDEVRAAILDEVNSKLEDDLEA